MEILKRISIKENKRLLDARKKDRIEEFREILQFMFILMIPVYLLFWLLDIIFAPQLKWVFLAMRLPMVPLAFVSYHATKKSHELRKLQLLGLFLAFYAGSTISIMAIMTGGVYSLYYAGLNLVAIATLCFLPSTINFKILVILAVYGTFYIGCFFTGLDSAGWHQLAIISWFMIGTINFSLVIRFFHDLSRVKELKTRLALHDEQKKLEKANHLIREAFGRYLSDDVVESILESPKGLSLGGERRRATIMVTDLRGFTAISEQIKPEQVVQLLNSYFQRMFDVAQEYSGTVNEISGDSLLLLFGAHQDLPARAQKAVACAIAMQNAMTAVNEANRAKGLPELEMGIGINEAEVIVGNVGSIKRSKYGVVGSGVNMTHRIQSYATGGQVLISESVRKDVGDILRIDDRMEVQPKGSEAPIVLYEIGGIGDSYNLVLEDRETRLISLSREIDIRYSALDGKHITSNDRPGKIINLSLNACGLQIQTALEPLTNLKFKLAVVSPELASKDFYGKVEKDFCADPHACRVRFTALPPAISGYFQAILDREVEDTNKLQATSISQ